MLMVWLLYEMKFLSGRDQYWITYMVMTYLGYVWNSLAKKNTEKKWNWSRRAKKKGWQNIGSYWKWVMLPEGVF